jgi:probable addiction module antidote protein
MLEMAGRRVTIKIVTRKIAAFMAQALGNIAKAKGISQIAKDSGWSRESRYKALSGERSPGFDTILRVIDALGMKLHAEVK